MSTFTGNLFLLPLVAQQTTGSGGTSPRAQQQWRYHLPGSYVPFLLFLIAAYLVAIFSLDNIACSDTDTCYNYSKLEWSFSASKVNEALAAWNAKARAAMALSAGLHIGSAYLFGEFFIFGGLQAHQLFTKAGHMRTAAIGRALSPPARIFSLLYCAAHTTIAAMVVGGNPHDSQSVAAGILIVIALIILVLCALYLIASLVYGTIYCLRQKLRPGNVHAGGDSQLLSKV